MKSYISLLVALFLFYLVSGKLTCEKDQTISWSGTDCKCNGTHYICDKIPTKPIDYNTCLDKVIKWACGDCVCNGKQYHCDIKCEPSIPFGKPGYCIPNSLIGDPKDYCVCFPEGNYHFCQD